MPIPSASTIRAVLFLYWRLVVLGRGRFVPTVGHMDELVILLESLRNDT